MDNSAQHQALLKRIYQVAAHVPQDKSPLSIVFESEKSTSAALVKLASVVRAQRNLITTSDAIKLIKFTFIALEEGTSALTLRNNNSAFLGLTYFLFRLFGRKA